LQRGRGHADDGQRRGQAGQHGCDRPDRRELGHQEAQHVQHRQRRDPAPHRGAEADLRELADAAALRQPAPDRAATPGEDQEGQGGADGIAGHGHRPDEGPHLRRREQDPRAQARGQEGHAECRRALAVARGQVVVEVAVGRAGAQSDPREENKRCAERSQAGHVHVALPPPA